MEKFKIIRINMCNGAAGCGWEFRNDGYPLICPFLDKTDEFKCLKYNKTLKTHTTSGHPFRCVECGEDAAKHVESLLAKKDKKSRYSYE